MKNIFVTATNTDIGKTYATTVLIEAFSKMGYKVGAFKPIETGVIDSPKDAQILLETCQTYNPQFSDITLSDVCPLQFSLPAAPYVAKGTKTLDFDKIQSSYEKIQQISDIVLIEGAGGLMVPLEADIFMIDLIRHFDAHTLLVTHDRLGSINDTLLSLEALASRGLQYTWCINRRAQSADFESITLPYYTDRFQTLYSLQHDLEKLTKRLIAYSHGHR